VKGRGFDVVQRVRVRLARRGLASLWTRLVVLDMTSVDSGRAFGE
jgi:hypothetical protein